MKNGENKRIGAADIVLAVLCVLYFIGTLTILTPCEAMADGWMKCHWAGNAVAPCCTWP